MPIQEISRSADGPEMKKVCQACGNVDAIKIDALKLGTKTTAEAIELPPCLKCGAVETMIRTVAAGIPDRVAGHRKAVNAVANYLTTSGKVDASALAPGQVLAPAQPVGELYGVVVNAQPRQVPHAKPTALGLAMEALAAAQAAVAAATKAK